MFDVMKFIRDYKIDHTTSGKHSRSGWIQVKCPFCGPSDKYFLGLNIEEGYGTCWQCKGKSTLSIVKALAKVDDKIARRILFEYESATKSYVAPKQSKEELVPLEIRLPLGTSSMLKRHKAYLESRNFDAEQLESVFQLQGTGPLGSYKHRIILPIYFNGKIVSYQGRDVTGKSELKYKACSMDEEVIHHKHVLYGWDLVKGDACVIVEGAADVWRLGPGALATFGTGYKKEQAVLISKRFCRAFIAFDPEPIAQKVAEGLADHLVEKGLDVHIVELDDCDPGDMEQEDADNLMRDIGIKGWNR